MRCNGCIWYDKGKCLKLGRPVRIRLRPCPYRNKVPEMAAEYIKSMSETTGLPIEVVMKSEPVKRYLEKFREQQLL